MYETVHCYGQACCLLADTRNETRKLANNTYLVPRGENVAVKLHNTDVVTFCADGSIILDSGGWRTVTTKARINEYLPSGWRVFSDRGKWFLRCGSWADGVDYPFADGMKIMLRGRVIGAASESDVKKEENLRKSITKYAKDYVNALYDGKISMPDAGDCWFCSMFDKEGGPGSDPDHLISHIKERYYVPSLLFNALKSNGAGKAWYWDAQKLMGGSNDSQESKTFGKIQGGMFLTGEWGHKQFANMIRRYLRRRLGIA